MMRIAIAGSGGLAHFIAYYIHEETRHETLFLSRIPKPQLAAQGHQVQVVDYNDPESLLFALRGIDTVISTVTGPPQLQLIRAAVQIGVRRFAPAEFDGPPSLRPNPDPLDRGQAAALAWLAHHRNSIQSTVFVCGILYERFQQGGLAQSRIGLSSGVAGEGDYIMDIRNMSAQVPVWMADNSYATVCLTAAHDVGRFVAKAIDLPQWPAELRMCGERVTVNTLVQLVQQLKGTTFNPIQWHNPASLRSALILAVSQHDVPEQWRLQNLIATSAGRFDFVQPNLNAQFPAIQPLRFDDWLSRNWELQ
ncbi:hypothetical protein B0A49_02304 [Cryomyces minteri]|uniref:Uncharacterized protein n=1 Tax=Cryomyces minteri TaxID=331657 RepID=A0A4U0XU47_9PEZI|nr:hypothetical protein B0A49_02304 [Cryomyces minteri]